MTTIAQGASASLSLASGETVAMASNGGFWSYVVTPIGGVATTHQRGPNANRSVIGPYGSGAVITISNRTCDNLSYTPSDNETYPNLSAFGGSPGQPAASAFQQAYMVAALSLLSVPGVPDPRAGVSINVPAGTYTVDQMESLISHNAPVTKGVGLNFIGAGAALTRVIYTPTTSGPLARNWKFSRVWIQGFEFIGTDLASNFLQSEEQNGTTNISNYNFYDCWWSGSWNNIFYLGGVGTTNNNSEWKVFNCQVSPSANLAGAWLFTDTAANGGSDQFLNFWFHGCKFWPTTGQWLKMNTGGGVEITACDVSGWTPTVDTYLFEFLGTNHSSGVCTVKIKTRLELKSDHALIMRSLWEKGNFDLMFDASSQTRTATFEPIVIDWGSGNAKGAQYNFHDSQLPGICRFLIGTNGFRFSSTCAFTDCSFLSQNCSDDYIKVTDGSGGNTGGWPLVNFTRCRYANADVNSDVFKDFGFESDYGWQKRQGGSLKPRIINAITGSSGLPTSSQTRGVRLPRFGIIKSITLTKFDDPAGAGTGNGGAYSWDIRDGSGTVLCNFSGASSSVGATTKITTFNGHAWPYYMSDDNKRTINVVETTGSRIAVSGFALEIEYLG